MKKKIKVVLFIYLISLFVKMVYARGYHNPEHDMIWILIIGFLLAYYLIEYIKENIEQFIYKFKKKHKDTKKKKSVNEAINETEEKEIVKPNIRILRSEVINLINQLTLTEDTKILWTNLVNNMTEEEKLIECKKKCTELMDKEK